MRARSCDVCVCVCVLCVRSGGVRESFREAAARARTPGETNDNDLMREHFFMLTFF